MSFQRLRLAQSLVSGKKDSQCGTSRQEAGRGAQAMVTLEKWPAFYSVLHNTQHSAGLGTTEKFILTVCLPLSLWPRECEPNQAPK